MDVSYQCTKWNDANKKWAVNWRGGGEMGLAGKIKELLKEQDMSQRELAKKAPVSQATISRLLTGKVTNVRRDTLERIGNVLGVSADFFLGVEETPEAKHFFRGYEKLNPKGKELLKDFLRILEKREGQEPGAPS
jgi:transcriptional regulator with XRE-family HTH domain